ncbi:NepR family anti-sigma factor [Roseobacteraceae bacterium NS-SX3]
MKKPMNDMTQHKADSKASERAGREIDQNLKRAFDQMASEPVPDRFTDLLKQLREKESGKSGTGTDE